MLDQVRDKLAAGERLDRKEGRWLLAEAPLLEAGTLANDRASARGIWNTWLQRERVSERLREALPEAKNRARANFDLLAQVAA